MVLFNIHEEQVGRKFFVALMREERHSVFQTEAVSYYCALWVSLPVTPGHFLSSTNTWVTVSVCGINVAGHYYTRVAWIVIACYI